MNEINHLTQNTRTSLKAQEKATLEPLSPFREVFEEGLVSRVIQSPEGSIIHREAAVVHGDRPSRCGVALFGRRRAAAAAAARTAEQKKQGIYSYIYTDNSKTKEKRSVLIRNRLTSW